MSQVFPKWINLVPKVIAPLALGGLVTVAAGYLYYVDNKYWMVGYTPQQPVDYSHQIHVGKLGLDCRHCHSHVEESYTSNIPATSTCMNCHSADDATDAAFLSSDLWKKHKTNKNLVTLRGAFYGDETKGIKPGSPVEWRKIHKVPDYVHFPHAAHVNAGVSCYSCHGRIDQLETVRQEKSLAMGWCLECHRSPEKNLIDNKGDLGAAVMVTDLKKVADLLAGDDQLARGLELAKKKQIQPPQNCAACHY